MSAIHEGVMPGSPQVSDFVEWDVVNWSRALDFWMANKTQAIPGRSALEIGSRRGGLSLWLAAQNARVVCSDISCPGDEVKAWHRARGIPDLIRYEAIDVADIPYTDEFDFVVFKSVLGAVGRQHGREGQARAIRSIHKALKKGGELFFAENLIATSLHRLLRRSCVPWGKTWRYVSLSEMTEFLSPFSEVRYRTFGFAGAFGRTENQKNLLGNLDKKFFDHVIPESRRYIMAGVARK